MNKKFLLLLSFCVLFFAYQYGLRSAIPNVLNGDLQTYFNIGTTQIGFLVSLFYLTYTIMQIPVGLIMDRFNPKIIAILSFFGFTLGLILFVSTQNFTFASVIQIFLGFWASFSFLLIMKITNDFCPKKNIPLVSGIAVSTGSLGPILCTPLLAYLAGFSDWRNVMYCMGLFGITCICIYCFLLKDISFYKPTETSQSFSSIIKDIKVLVADHRYMVIGVFSMSVLGPLSSFCDVWGISFIMNTYMISREQAAFAVAFTYAGTIIGGPIFAYLAERLNNYKIVMISGASCFGLVISAISFIQLPLPILYFGLLLMGTTASSHFIAFPAALTINNNKLGATVTGIVNTLTMLGCTILIWVFGFILDLSKGTNPSYSIMDYKLGMVASIVSVIIAVLCISFIKLPTPIQSKD